MAIDWDSLEDAPKDEEVVIQNKESPSQKNEINWESLKDPEFDFSDNLEARDQDILGTLGSYGKTAIKGAAEGINKLGQMLGPLQKQPHLPKNGQPKEDTLTEGLDKLLPTGEEDFGQKALRRGLNTAPSALTMPGAGLVGNLSRSLLSGFFGETAKELGAPEWAQAAAEVTAFLGPDVTKKLLETGKNKDIIKAARDLGMSDEAITPLIQSEFKQKWLSKFVSKRGKTQEALNKSKDELGNSYTLLRKKPEAKSPITEPVQKNLISKLDELISEMPADVRNKIKEDYADLTKGPISIDSLINFYQDINHNLGRNTKQLVSLKNPIKEAISKTSLGIGEEFDIVNKLYSKYHAINKKLSPTIASDILEGGEAIGLLFSLVTGNYPVLTSVVTEKSAKYLAKQMLINPRFQQLGSKVVNALKQNKYTAARTFIDQIAKEVTKTAPEEAEMLKNLSDDELDMLVKGQPTKETQKT